MKTECASRPRWTRSYKFKKGPGDMGEREEVEEKLKRVGLEIDQIWMILRDPYVPRKRRAELEGALIRCEGIRSELLSARATLKSQTSHYSDPEAESGRSPE